jgi:myo-inositol-1(or 4)-monophosphatase
VPPLHRNYRPSIAYRLALVAEGRFDAMLTFRETWEWDIAAGVDPCAGGRGDGHRRLGRPIRFNRETPKADGIVGAPKALHETLLRYRLAP